MFVAFGVCCFLRVHASRIVFAVETVDLVMDLPRAAEH